VQYFGVSVRCLGGIWSLSEWLLILSGGYNVQTPISLIFTSWFLFCQLPQIIQNGPNFGVSGGCLEGVLEVSGNYLSDPGYCLEGYVVGSIEKKIILGPKSPKIGHCEKMSQLIKMTQNDFFFNWANNIPLQTVSRVTQIIPRHLQDTLQTPSGHPKIWPILYNLRQLAEKESAGENEWNGCLHIVPPWQYQESLRQTPDASQTPYRHPKILHILTNLSNSGKGNKLIKNVPNLIVINCLHIIHPRKYSESLRPPDTPQTQ
jgi:hypothetical protein